MSFATVSPQAKDPPVPSSQHRMKPRHLKMMGLGSVIGAGLFLGSGVGVQIAGPAVLLAYAVAGVLVMITMGALGEMASANPQSGAFAVYATQALGPVVGVSLGWLWWLQIVIVVAAEAVGAASLLATLWPSLSVPLCALTVMVCFTLINLCDVRHMGEFEFWLTLIKVVAVLAFIAVGVVVIAGQMPGVPSPGLTNLIHQGGFAPHGLSGVATALLVVMFAFGGTEIVVIAAADTADPGRILARTIGIVAFRILIFYLGSMAVIVTLIPWHSDALKSPFAAVLALAKIPGAVSGITLIAVTALLSALNSNLYGASRMISALAHQGEAPSFLGYHSARNVPVWAVLCSALVGFSAALWEFLMPNQVLNTLLNVVGASCLLVWGIALLSQCILRAQSQRKQVTLPYVMPGYPWLTLVGLALMGGVFILALVSSQTRPKFLAMLMTVTLIAVIRCAVGARRRRREKSSCVG